MRHGFTDMIRKRDVNIRGACRHSLQDQTKRVSVFKIQLFIAWKALFTMNIFQKVNSESTSLR